MIIIYLNNFGLIFCLNINFWFNWEKHNLLYFYAFSTLRHNSTTNYHCSNTNKMAPTNVNFGCDKFLNGLVHIKTWIRGELAAHKSDEGSILRPIWFYDGTSSSLWAVNSPLLRVLLCTSLIINLSWYQSRHVCMQFTSLIPFSFSTIHSWDRTHYWACT